MKSHHRTKSGIVVTLPDWCEVADQAPAKPTSRSRRARGAKADQEEPAPPLLFAALAEQDMRVVDSFEMESSRTALIRSAAAGGPAQVAMVEVELEPGERAMVLTEDDGLWCWHYPSEPAVKAGPSARDAPAAKASFVIPLADDAAPDPDRAGLGLVSRLLSGVRTYVFKFAAAAIAEFAMNQLEAEVDEGPVWIQKPDPADWVRADAADITVRDRAEGPPRILVFIHGTFSSTVGSFGAMPAVNEGATLLQGALNFYDLVVGYDHRTLSKTPEENASDIWTFLRQLDLPDRTRIDAVCFSRGGLVYRCLTELGMPDDVDVAFHRTVYVGCTNSGTELAAPGNWDRLIDVYTNLVTGVGAAAGSPAGLAAVAIARGLGLLLKHIVAVSVNDREVPGLAAMDPSGDLVRRLNRVEDLPDGVKGLRWFAVTSDFEPRVNDAGLPAGVVKWLADAAVDRLMGGIPNDLVVHTRSMTRIDPSRRPDDPSLVFGGSLAYQPADGVIHTRYFEHGRTPLFLGARLALPGFAERPPASLRSLETSDQLTAALGLHVRPDRVDLRDWVYRPGLQPLPDVLVNIDRVPEVLDQGREGACTGFALAAVINYLLDRRDQKRRVSPYMLYELARRYDEWPGEDYEGSSARGAMKAWVAHGVCDQALWPSLGGLLDETAAAAAQRSPGGAYYRVSHREVRDLHAALFETGILFATLRVHAGWANPERLVDVRYASSGNFVERKLALIERRQGASGGHAVAIVGYTRDGFVIQNSWGRDWGTEGFALLPYDDYLLHAMDVWVAQLGVPLAAAPPESTDLVQGRAGAFRISEQVPLASIRPYLINIGNNGRLSDSGHYWTTPADAAELVRETIPRTVAAWKTKRILLYLHGGLNDEKATAKRVVAMRDTFLENHVYPLHVMWESGAGETIRHLIEDLFTRDDERAGSVGDWMHRFRENLTEARNETLEMTLARPGSLLWGEMKENAKLASVAPFGAMNLVARHAGAMVGRLAEEERDEWELHVVGHSAGSIFAAYAMPVLLGLGLPIRSTQFLAPALTIADFKATLLPLIRRDWMEPPTVYLLDDAAERRDRVWIYGHSLLYLVSNAFEGRRGTPLLGMETCLNADGELNDIYREGENLIVARRTTRPPRGGTSASRGRRRRGAAPEDGGNSAWLSAATTHGGFDNDPATMNEVLRRILGKRPETGFTGKILEY